MGSRSYDLGSSWGCTGGVNQGATTQQDRVVVEQNCQPGHPGICTQGGQLTPDDPVFLVPTQP